MKRKTEVNADYSKLIRKLFLQSIGMVFVAFFIVILFYRYIWLGNGADTLVMILQRVFRLSYEEALSFYHFNIRRHFNVILFLAVLVVFFLIFRIFLSWFTKYFNEINRGINSLLDDNEKEIILPPEMSATEKRLNAVKQTLEKRTLEAQLAEQKKNDLVMYLAHDIRTPLTSIIGYLSLLDEAPDMPLEQKAKYTRITLEKAYRLETLVNEFFEITRFNLQQIMLEKEKIDLYYMLVQMIDEFYPILQEKKNTAVLQADENLTVYGDPLKLARVFNNLLKNASSYSYPNTEIRVFAVQKEEDIIIRFQNEGPTIPQEKLSSVFEKFYRVNEARTADTGNAGLGLSIAKEIITLHGGTITAQSEENTITFLITLPVSG